MAKVPIRHLVCVQDLGDGARFVQLPRFPELSLLVEGDPGRPRSAAGKRLAKLLRAADALATEDDEADLHERTFPWDAMVRAHEIDIPPSDEESARRRKPLMIRLQSVQWRHGEESGSPDTPPTFVAWVPALGISVLSRSEDALAELVVTEVRLTIARSGLLGRIESLAQLDRTREVELHVIERSVTLRSGGQEPGVQTDPRETLRSCAGDLIPEVRRLYLKTRVAAFERDDDVRRLAELLTGAAKRSVLLVGPPGVGKTAVVHELVRRRAQLGLGKRELWETSGSRLVAGMTGFGEWQERCESLRKELSSINGVLVVGSLRELMEVGRSEHNAQGIASYLAPHARRGSIVLVAECTHEERAAIERRDPQILQAFEVLEIDPPDQSALRRILRQVAASIGLAAAPGALDAVVGLHRRFAGYSAPPGRQIRFLQRCAAEQKRVAGPSELSVEGVTDRFSEETGLPRRLIDDAQTLDLDAAREWFEERLVGQAPAREIVLDLITTFKARLTRPGRPIASLLFIGPTGVGKTEMAKCLAEFVFSDRERLVRFDMSEYQDPVAVTRLIGGLGASEGLLTGRVREQPFSVVLFDECEKADAAFFDLLLQILGDGRLTDARGRVADFSSAIVILTSNLGAERAQRGEIGFEDSTNGAGAQQVFLEAVRSFLRPELFNRIDRIVPFGALASGEIERIARRELAALWRRGGLRDRRELQLEIAPDVAAALTELSHDVRYGARPLKRAIERHLAVPLAEDLKGTARSVPVTITVGVAQGALRVDVRGHARVLFPEGERTVRSALEWVQTHRRLLDRWQQSRFVRELRNESVRQALDRGRRKPGSRRVAPATPRDAERVRALEALDEHTAEVLALESETMVRLHTEASVQAGSIDADVQRIDARGKRLADDLLALRYPDGDAVTLVLRGHGSYAAMLGNCYARLARKHDGLDASVFCIVRRPAAAKTDDGGGDALDGTPLVRLGPVQHLHALEVASSEIVAFLVHVTGRLGRAWFVGESGAHRFRVHGGRPVWVHVSCESCRPAEYVPPDGGRMPREPQEGPRRTYSADLRTLDDHELHERLTLPGGEHALVQGLHECVTKLLVRTRQELLEK